MGRYRLDLEYHGGAYFGFQRQAGQMSVQQALEDAIAGFARHPVTVHVAGRTDTGVHASGQVAHVDLERDWEPDKVREAANGILRQAGHRIAVLRALRVTEAFHARFSATARHYRYVILDRRAPAAIEAGLVWWVLRRLDEAAMAQAAGILLGHHDFTTFRATQCQAKSPMRTLDRLDVTREDGRIVVRTSSRAFLHSQVRSMVGSLKLVGEGRWSQADLAAALAARRRTACGPVAPPDGLTLTGVDYPASVGGPS